MTVPLPQRGLYLLSFPITPDTPTNPGISHQLISDFEVSPTPPQVARLLPGRTWSHAQIHDLWQRLGLCYVFIRPYLLDYEWVSCRKCVASS